MGCKNSKKQEKLFFFVERIQLMMNKIVSEYLEKLGLSNVAGNLKSLKNKTIRPLLLLCIVLIGLSHPAGLFAQDIARELNSGWYTRPPYQMETKQGNLRLVTGLDIQTARELFQETNNRIHFQPMPWEAMMKGLKQGTIDFVMGAYYLEEREAFAWFSQPYRTEQNAVYYHRDIKTFEGLQSVEALTEVLLNESLIMAINEGYTYGSESFTSFLKTPPPSLQFAVSSGYEQNIDFVLQRKADFFVSNPIIMDQLLTEKGYKDIIKKSRVDMGEVPVHIMFSKQSVKKAEVENWDAVLRKLKDDGFIHSLHINYILPAYLTITTGRFWFILLNYLGIIAFCTSGVILARKERYNLFGALLLAILPAIGGGVLRDLILGADKVFILENPGYMLFAVTIVFISFVFFRVYDYLQVKSGKVTQKIDQYTDATLGVFFDKTYKLLDAWAVAAFSIIGVSVAIEQQASPLWLWGPSMAVITASGGVVLRDIVRADFNIAILKQDSYAEISLLGGALYTLTLVYIPLQMSLELIFYVTMAFIVMLFVFRFFVLYKGYENPIQFGAIHSSPARRLQTFSIHEPDLWQLFTRYYLEDNQGNAVPVSQAVLEKLHNQFLYTKLKLRNILDEVVAEPLSDQNLRSYKNCAARLEIASAIEEILFVFFQLPPGVSLKLSARASELQQRLHEGLKTNLETASDTIKSNETMDYHMLEMIVSKHQERFDELRDKYEKNNEDAHDFTLHAVMQTTHKAERIIYLLGEYVKVRLEKKEFRSGSATNRKAQQVHLIN